MIDNKYKYDPLKFHALENPDLAAVQTNSTVLSFKEVNEFSERIAAGFFEKGIHAGDHVTIYGGNNLEFVIATSALWKLGAVPIPINIRSLPDQVAEYFNYTNSKFILTTGQTECPIKDLKKEKVINFSEVNRDLKYSERNITKNDTALIMFTSGSSSKPKAVIHSFENLLNSAKRFNNLVPNIKGKKWFASLPFYHIGGFSIIVRSLFTASSLVIPDTLEHSSIESAIKKNKPNFLSFVPATLQRFIINKFKFPDEVEMIFIGGGPAIQNLSISAIQLGYPIYHVYGSTETFAMITAAGPEIIKKFPKTSGKPLLGCEIKVMDDYGKELDHLCEGEIVVKTNSLFNRYLCLSDQKFISDGFFRTGDIGHLDKNGLLFIERRKDSFIISGGEKIDPRELKNAILKIGGIEDVFIVGIADDKWGEIAAALIQPGKNIAITPELLITLLRDRLPSFKIPKVIKFTDKMPKNELGKLDRPAALKILTS